MQQSTVSEATGHKVTKAEIVAYVERTFLRADQDGDGLLSVQELAQFLELLCHPRESAALSEPSVGRGRDTSSHLRK